MGVDVNGTDVWEIRAIHAQVDRAVLDAYGWSDLASEHGFHEFRKMTRWTLDPATRVEVLDRLLEENQRRTAFQRPEDFTLGSKTLDEGDALFS